LGEHRGRKGEGKLSLEEVEEEEVGEG